MILDSQSKIITATSPALSRSYSFLCNGQIL